MSADAVVAFISELLWKLNDSSRFSIYSIASSVYIILLQCTYLLCMSRFLRPFLFTTQ